MPAAGSAGPVSTAAPSGTPPVRQCPARDISRWSSQLLELVLCHLDPSDLAHASQTCRHWHQAASRHALQVLSLLNAFPPLHRHQLEQAMDAHQARQVLLRWCLLLPHACPERAELEWLAGQRLPASRLFCELTRRMLGAERILFDEGNLGILSGFRSEDARLYSPDGKYLVTPATSHTGLTRSLNIWQQEEQGLVRAARCDLDPQHAVHTLTFSADSRSLLVFTIQGELQTWQPHTDGNWHLSRTSSQSPRPVSLAQFSPDAHWLALKVNAWLHIFGETGPDNAWQECFTLRWTDRPAPIFGNLLRLDKMTFSADSRHLLFLHYADTFVLDRQTTDWQAHKISHPLLPASYETGELSPLGDWLALSARPPIGEQADNSARIELWQRLDEQPHWRLSSERLVRRAGAFCPVVAFSPDGRQLAVPDRLDNQNLCVSLLSLTPDGSWTPAYRLQLGPGITYLPGTHGIDRLSFSAQGRYLAAASSAGVQIWRRHTATWQPVVWVANWSATSRNDPCYSFSPDGCHCAVSTGDEGHVSIHGPGPGGHYLTKMQVTQAAGVLHLLFSPDGFRLLVSSRYKRRYRTCTRSSLLHLAPAANTDWRDSAAGRLLEPAPVRARSPMTAARAQPWCPPAPAGEQTAAACDQEMGMVTAWSGEAAALPPDLSVPVRLLHESPLSNPLVLSLVLRYLDLADLAPAARTCRQWHWSASCPDLQAHSFMRAYPVHYRQHLRQTLNRELACQFLSLWSPQVPDNGAQRQEQEQLVEYRLSAYRLSWELTRRMLQAARVLFNDGNLGLRSASYGVTVYSPDGNYLVTQTALSLTGLVPCLSVWQHTTHDLHQAAQCRLDSQHTHNGLSFSADSRSLLAVTREGVLQIWRLQADNSWQLSVTANLSPGPIPIASFSPDTRWLAMKVGHQLQMFGEAAPAAWQRCCNLRWTHLPATSFDILIQPDTMQWSADSRHFLLVNNGHAFILDRQARDWQEQEIRQDSFPTFYRKGELSPQADWLALALQYRNPPQVPQDGYTIELWQRHSARPHWRFFSQNTYLGTRALFPMTFSLDGRQLAVPDRLENGNQCLAVLSLTPDGDWTSATRLRLGPGIAGDPLRTGIYAISFSAQGCFLAATARAGVQIWRLHADTWNPVAWIENWDLSIGSEPCCRFSPDGWHCAISRGDKGCVSFHGPGPGGRYLTKMQVNLGDPVHQMQFAPEGLRLLVLHGITRSLFQRARFFHLMPVAETTACGQAPPDACHRPD